MNDKADTLELRCPACTWSEVCDPEAMARWLRRAGKLRATSPAEPEIVVELFRNAAARFACPACGEVGLTAGEMQEKETDWPGAVSCAGCGKPIPRERLDAIPGVVLCAACQRREELGAAPEDVEYCPHCGAPMALRLSRSAGVTRYVMTCTAQPPCRR